jgi:hypothetical protein
VEHPAVTVSSFAAANRLLPANSQNGIKTPTISVFLLDISIAVPDGNFALRVITVVGLSQWNSLESCVILMEEAEK